MGGEAGVLEGREGREGEEDEGAVREGRARARAALEAIESVEEALRALPPLKAPGGAEALVSGKWLLAQVVDLVCLSPSCVCIFAPVNVRACIAWL